MYRNQNSLFATNPTNIDMSRSTFDRNQSLKTSFNAGDVVPFYLDEVLPGDTHQIRTSKVIRMPSLITPVMDNIVLDTFFFFVPARLCWDHWKEFMGENTESAWIPETEYAIPQITAPEGGWNVGTIADYLGLPTGVENISVNALPFRAYALVMNEWFRDQNLTDPLNIDTGDSSVQGVNTGTYVTDVAKGGLPFKAGKFHDLFTSALPAPQKGPAVTINVATSQAPVFGNGFNLGFTNGEGSLAGLGFNHNNFERLILETGGYGVQSPARTGGSGVSVGSNFYGGLSLVSKEQVADHPEYSGLYADFGSVSVMTINDLRMAFQIQKYYEKAARGGTRYIEVIKAHFGVTSPDARLQRPEYLGGTRIPIMVNQVVQNSGTADGTTPQGNTAAYSLTADTHGDFIKSFTEHGYIIGVMVARYDHSYQQGIDRMWSRKSLFDFYFPVFANIGEQAVRNSEIFAQGNNEDGEVFGYQEAWYDYRYKANKITGQMRSGFAQSLDSWHLGDDYSALPRLSDEWIREDPSNIDRIIAVSSEVAHQFFGDIYIENRTTRPMPVRSIPGLIDHH